MKASSETFHGSLPRLNDYFEQQIAQKIFKLKVEACPVITGL